MSRNKKNKHAMYKLNDKDVSRLFYEMLLTPKEVHRYAGCLRTDFEYWLPAMRNWVPSAFEEKQFIMLDNSISPASYTCGSLQNLIAFVQWVDTDRQIWKPSNIQSIFDTWLILENSSQT